METKPKDKDDNNNKEKKKTLYFHFLMTVSYGTWEFGVCTFYIFLK